MTREQQEMTTLRDQAAHWWVLLQDKDASPADKREFAAWALQAPERVEAMLRVARIHKALASPQMRWAGAPTDELIREAKAAPEEVVLQLPGARLPPPEARARLPAQTPRPKRVAAMALGMAAAVLLAVSLSWYRSTRPEPFQTNVGEQRSIVLDDGSRVMLNTASRIEVRLRKDRRIVDLVQGEALFEVAPDKQRPFDVKAGDVVVRAVGTQFDVDRRPARTVLTVMEGRVAVVTDGSRRTTLPVLSAGDRVIFGTGGPPRVESDIDLGEATAWTRGELVFRRRPLGEIAEEFNRYNTTRVEIRSPDLQRREVTGRFRTDDVASFIALLSGIPAVHVVREGTSRYIVTSNEAASPRK